MANCFLDELRLYNQCRVKSNSLLVLSQLQWLFPDLLITTSLDTEPGDKMPEQWHREGLL